MFIINRVIKICQEFNKKNINLGKDRIDYG